MKRIIFLLIVLGSFSKPAPLDGQALPVPAAVRTGVVPSATINTPETASEDTRSLARIAARLEALDASASRNWLPLKTEKEARQYWGGADALQFLPQLKFFAADERRTIATDVVVDFIGPTRHAFGFSLSQGGGVAETEDEADAQTNLEKVMAAGGDAYLTIAYPLLCVPKCPYADSTDDTTNVTVTDRMATFTILAAPRVAALIPALGNTSANFGGSGDVALEAAFTLGRSNANIQYVFQARHGYMFAADDFAKDLELKDETNHYVTNFWFGQWSMGIRLKGLFLVGLQGITTAPKSFRDRIPVRLVTQIIPAVK